MIIEALIPAVPWVVVAVFAFTMAWWEKRRG